MYGKYHRVKTLGNNIIFLRNIVWSFERCFFDLSLAGFLTACDVSLAYSRLLFLFVLPALNTTSAIDRIMLSGADSWKLGLSNTKLHLLSRYSHVGTASTDPQSRIVHDVDVAINVVGAVVKSNEAIEIPFRSPSSFSSCRNRRRAVRFASTDTFFFSLFFPTIYRLGKRVKSDERKKKSRRTVMWRIVKRVETFNTRNAIKWQLNDRVK